MASDRAQYREARKKWDDLQKEGSFSVPANDGRVAIITPYDSSAVSKFESFERFQKQANALAEFILNQSGVEPVMAPNAVKSDIQQIYQDPSIASVCFIGRGTLSSIGSQDGPITWRDISEQSDHLKTGATYQLFCGWHPNTLNVPLGMFGMDDHRKTFAAPATYIMGRANPVKLFSNLSPAVNKKSMSYDELKAAFPAMQHYTGLNQLRLKTDRFEHHLRNGTLGKIALRELSRKLYYTTE